MGDDLLTKMIDFIFPRQKGLDKGEKLFWNYHWDNMIRYYKKHEEIFEINDKWDFYCNEALHEHYKSVVKDFNNIKCIECGSGGGYESALMTKDGAKVMVLDYSSKAIEYAKIVNQRIGVGDRIKFINNDIFNFSAEEEYDLAWNCGVIEHYPDEQIIQMIQKMSSFVRKGGLVILTVPNLLSPQSIY